MASGENFTKIRQKLRDGEDFDLANRLQQREFEMFYHQNRTINGTIVSDRKTSREEQQIENEHQLRCTTFDEELARQLQEEIDHEIAVEHLIRDEQMFEDHKLAWQIQTSAMDQQESIDNYSSPDQQGSSQFENFHDFPEDETKRFPEDTRPKTSSTMLLSPTNPFLHDVNEFFRNQSSQSTNR